MTIKINPLIVVAIILVIGFFIYKGTTSSNCNPIWKQDRAYDKVTFCSMKEALDKAEEIGCEGYHIHEQDDNVLFMACNSHTDLDVYIKPASTYSGGGY